jgi:hypothetical protein
MPQIKHEKLLIKLDNASIVHPGDTGSNLGTDRIFCSGYIRNEFKFVEH